MLRSFRPWVALYCKFTAVLQGGQKKAPYCGHVAYSAQQPASLGVSPYRGFIRAAERIKVAMTRAKFLHITICDVSILTDKTNFFKWFADSETQVPVMAVKLDQNRYLQPVFDYYQSRNVTSVVRSTSLKDEYEFMDMTEGEQLLLQLKQNNQSRCNNCGSAEHNASSCDQPHRSKCKICKDFNHSKEDCPFATCKRSGMGHQSLIYRALCNLLQIGSGWRTNTHTTQWRYYSSKQTKGLSSLLRKAPLQDLLIQKAWVGLCFKNDRSLSPTLN